MGSFDEMPKGAIKVMAHLDMLTDEPLELAIALRRLAESKADETAVGKQWQEWATSMVALVNELKAMNEPPPKAA